MTFHVWKAPLRLTRSIFFHSPTRDFVPNNFSLYRPLFLQLFRPTRIISIESQPKKIVVVVVVVIGVVVLVVVHVVVDPRILPLKFG